MLKAGNIFAVFSLTLCFFILRAPSVEVWLSDSDHYVSLALAEQIYRLGEHPYRDFYTDYGPLLNYISFIGQVISGHRIIAEIIISSLGFATAYSVCYFVMRKEFGLPAMSAAAVYAALLLVSPFPLYSYCFQLAIFLFLAAAAFYLRANSMRWLVLMALSIAVAGLFRHDYGVYTALGGGTAILLDTRLKAVSRIKRLLLLASLTFVFFSPWLIFLAWDGKALQYFHYIFTTSWTKGGQFALPHPLLDTGRPGLTALYALFFPIPFAAIAMSGYRFFKPSGISPGERAFCAALAVTAAAHLLVASHRSDFNHLDYIVPSSVMSLFAFFKLSGFSLQRVREIYFSVGVIAVLQFYMFFHAVPIKLLFPAVLKDSLYFASLERGEMLNDLKARYRGMNHEYVPLYSFLYNCTDPMERLGAWPHSGHMNYLAGRPIAGKLWVADPGYFNTPEFQKEIIETLKKQRVSFIIWDEKWFFDSKTERNSTVTHAMVWDYVRHSFFRLGHIGNFTVYSGKSPDALKREMKNGCWDELQRLLTPPGAIMAKSRKYPPPRLG